MQALVVDDSSTIRALLKSILIGFNFGVAEAGGGLEALLRLEHERFELALLDWNMPQITGFELLTRIRSDRSLAGIKVMMVTTESEQEQIARALEAGADEYIMKPFTCDDIAAKLQILGFPA